ncbi:MAG: hypothetical protein A2W22_05000 [Candidatus Levybacteria bacterium RBG_16_35_11]|nr:MAG: hypothetical protein A2W22_05000 [Candidatus Levybacteria bacterium RBG_16_35_11]
MKKRVFRIIVLVLIITTVVYFNGGLNMFKNTSTVRAFGDLTVDFHVPPGDPIFTVNNMAPGDPPETRNVDVTNGGTLPRYVAVKAVRTGGLGSDPKLETALDIVIKDGVTPIYGTGSLTGPKTLADFFSESTSENEIKLNIINPGGNKTYIFTVSLPSSAGNDFQSKSVIFDLTFGYITGNNVVINEVYYMVDASKGVDSLKDRGITGPINAKNACKILQQNSTVIKTGVLSSATTGGNTISGNTNSSTNIISGAANSIVNIVIGGSTNQASCLSKLGQNNEWVELFNPTDHDISLKKWGLIDNSGQTTTINANKIIKKGGFALVSKDSSTWSFWNTNGALKVELGKQIGDGLDNAGDHLILKNAQNAEIDRMSWGSDTSGFTPPAINPIVSLGSSTERLTPGFDSDTVSDWLEENPPTPGN